MKNQKQTLSENSLILIISTIFVKIIGAIFKIPLASNTFLGDVGFGYFSVAYDLFMPFYTLAISGLPVAVSHITAENLAKKRYNEVQSNFYSFRKLFIILGCIFSIIVSLLSIPLTLWSNSGMNNLYCAAAIIPAIFLCFIISIYRGYFEGFNRMAFSAVSRIIESVLKLIFGLLLAFIVIKNTSNPALAAAAALTSVAIGTLVATIYLRFKFKNYNLIGNLITGENTTVTSLSLKSIFIITIPFALASLATSLVAFIDVFTVKLQIANAGYLQSMIIQNSDVATYLYGIRSKAFTLFNLIPTITISLGVGALPVLTNLKTSDSVSNLKSNIAYTIKLISTITMPAGIGLAVLSHRIMNLLYHSNSALSGNILTVYGVAAIFAGLAVPLTTVMQSVGLQSKALKHIIFALIIKILGNTVLASIKTVNIYSVAIGTLLCYFYLCTVFLYIVSKETHNFSLKNVILKPLAAAIICGACAFLISLISSSSIITIIAILISILIYFATLTIFKAFTKEEILAIPILRNFLNPQNINK